YWKRSSSRRGARSGRLSSIHVNLVGHAEPWSTSLPGGVGLRRDRVRQTVHGTRTGCGNDSADVPITALAAHVGDERVALEGAGDAEATEGQARDGESDAERASELP